MMGGSFLRMCGAIAVRKRGVDVQVASFRPEGAVKRYKSDKDIVLFEVKKYCIKRRSHEACRQQNAHIGIVDTLSTQVNTNLLSTLQPRPYSSRPRLAPGQLFSFCDASRSIDISFVDMPHPDFRNPLAT